MKTLDSARPFSVVYGRADHAFEQDGLRFDRKGNCLDKAPATKETAPATKVPETAPAATVSQEPGPPAGVGAGTDDKAPGAPINVAALGLSTRIENALLGAGIDSVDKLCLASRSDLEALPNLGKASVGDIVKKLRAHGRKLST